MNLTALVIGVVLALFVSGFARVAGFDRDRAFYPTILVVIASYYVLFAVMGGSDRALLVESMVTAAFVLAAFLGFKFNALLIVAALAAHGGFDLLHSHIVINPGVPGWWRSFCLAYDETAASCLAWLLLRSKRLPLHASV